MAFSAILDKPEANRLGNFHATPTDCHACMQHLTDPMQLIATGGMALGLAAGAAAVLIADAIGQQQQRQRRRRRGTLFLVCGPSGAGKDTLLFKASMELSEVRRVHVVVLSFVRIRTVYIDVESETKQLIVS